MATKVRIKRSTTAVPSTLDGGELAFTSLNDVLYIGSPNGNTVTAIGGVRNPGTLTANQALVANSTSGIDKIITANLNIGALYANGSVGTAGHVLVTPGNGANAYWASAAAVGGVNTDATYTFSNTVTFNGNAVLTKVSANGSLGTAGQVLHSNGSAVYWAADDDVNTTYDLSVTGANTTSANVRLVGSDATTDQVKFQGSGTTTVSTDGTTVTITSADQFVGTVTSVGSGNGLSGGPITSSGTLSVLANSGIIANSTGVFVNANNGLVANSLGVHVNANNGIVANSTGVWARAANGITVDSGGINVNANNGLVANSLGVHVGSGNGISVSADAIAVTGGSTLTVNATGVHVNSTLTLTDLTLTGNLVVSGDSTVVNVATLSVEDSLIELARLQNDTASFLDTLDIGFFGSYGNTANSFAAGLFRDASDGIFKLFTSNAAVTNTEVSTGAGFNISTLQAYVSSGGLTTNSTSANLVANSTYAVGIVANSLTLSTPLAATSGGTGTGTYAVGDLLIGTTGNSLLKLAVAVDGKVLQSNGTTVIYDDIDAGTF